MEFTTKCCSHVIIGKLCAHVRHIVKIVCVCLLAPVKLFLVELVLTAKPLPAHYCVFGTLGGVWLYFVGVKGLCGCVCMKGVCVFVVC